VESIPQKLKQSRPMKTLFLFFCPYDNSGAEPCCSGADILRSKMLLLQAQFAPRTAPFGPRFWNFQDAYFWVIFQQQHLSHLRVKIVVYPISFYMNEVNNSFLWNWLIRCKISLFINSIKDFSFFNILRLWVFSNRVVNSLFTEEGRKS